MIMRNYNPLFLEYLLEASIKFNLNYRIDDKGTTPLILATKLNKEQWIDFILSRNKRTINTKDYAESNTPLHWALLFKNKSAIHKFRLYGASAKILNKHHEDALVLALSLKRLDLV